MNTDDDSFNNIIEIILKTIRECPPSQALSLEIYSCSNFVGNCVGSYDCLELIQNLDQDNILYSNCYGGFWSKFKEYFKNSYLNSHGLSGYIITNYNCSLWENTDLSLFYSKGKEVAQYLEEYSVVTKLIHITDADYGYVCIINPVINYTSPLLDVITISPQNIDHLSSDYYGMCTKESSYTKNLFGNNLDNYSNCTLYTVGVDETSCLSYTLFIYFAIKPDTEKSELNQILKLASNVFNKCTMHGTTVIYWSANPTNRYMKCDPSTEACREKITSLTIYDLSYQNTTDKQIDINSLSKALNSVDDFKVGQTVAFYIFSNLDNEQLSGSLLAAPLFEDSFDYGYFLYKNKIITHFIDLAPTNKIPSDKFRHLINSANEYFVFDIVANITEQFTGLSVILQICTGDAYYGHSSNQPKSSSSPNIEVILLIVCGSLIIICSILASCFLKCRTISHKIKLYKFSRMFAHNEAACEALEIAIKNKDNKEFQECMDIFKKNTDERYTNHLNDKVHDRYEMNIDDLAINYNSRLGSGAFAAVYKGFIKGTNPLKNACQSINIALDVMSNLTNEVAIKTCLRPNDTTERTNLLCEIKFMKELGYHPHIVNIIGCITNWELPLLVLEYCENEDLLKLLRKQNKCSKKNDNDDTESDLTMKDLYSFAWQVADGMVYLSSKNVIHRDIAARNILITKNYVAKISDFGLCRSMEEMNYTTKGGKFPIRWMSYEALKYYTFSIKSDVWAYGVLLYEIFSYGEVPYKTVQLYDLVDHLGAGNRLTKPEYCTDEVYKIMSECWDEDPEKRPTFSCLKSYMGKYLELNSESYGYIELLPDFNKIYLEITETMQKPVTKVNDYYDVNVNNMTDDNKNTNDYTKVINDADNKVENVNIDSINV